MPENPNPRRWTDDQVIDAMHVVVDLVDGADGPVAVAPAQGDLIDAVLILLDLMVGLEAPALRLVVAEGDELLEEAA